MRRDLIIGHRGSNEDPTSCISKTGTCALGTSCTEHVDLCLCLKDRTVVCEEGHTSGLVSESTTLLIYFMGDKMVHSISGDQSALTPVLMLVCKGSTPQLASPTPVLEQLALEKGIEQDAAGWRLVRRKICVLSP